MEGEIINEFWIDVVGFEGLYEVSHLGRVKSVRRQLKPHLGSEGYYEVKLRKSGKSYLRRNHRLVAEAFIDNPETKRTVDHINRNKQDNRVCNLRWATDTEQNFNRDCSEFGKRYNKYFCKTNNRWKVIYRPICKNIKSKSFLTEKEADDFILTLDRNDLDKISKPKVDVV